jgi:hypothetical protein
MNSTKKNARVAGVLYLSLGATAPFSLIYIPRTLIVRGNAAATANNIIAHQSLFRLGIVAELVAAITFIFVALALYRLLKEVNPTHAALMMILALVSVPIGFLNVLNNAAALTLLSGADHLSVFRADQLQSLVMLFLTLHGYGNVVAAIFWGLWLFPFGLLVYRSGFIPRILGVWLIINCFGYLAMSFTALLLPDYKAVVSLVTFPALLGELAIMLWLLIKGAKVQPLPDSAFAPAGG